MKSLIAAALATTALATGALAQNAAPITEFRIGILGGENASDRMNNNECLRKYIEDALGVPTKIFAPADYNGVMQGLMGGTIDFAGLGASSYAGVYVQDPTAVTPVLTTANPDGSYVYYSIGFARKDHNITSMADMQGKVLGFGDPNSTSGYLIPSVELPSQGYSVTPGEYFKDVVFTGGHEQTIVAVNNGDIDGGVTWADGQGNWEDGFNNGALRKAVDAGLIDMNDLVEIWRSKPIPNGPFVVRNALPDDVKAKVIAVMENLKANDPDCAYGVAGGDNGGFVKIDPSYYDSIIAVRRAKSN
ncbi:MAG: phosphonate ABC transporter substrate-binding protein [Limimaricola sp.]|uniref:phosphonate ABC transporter substrate-binding protein n=1 Tax=Limimaricola sp. TaxID=2211665 RepID=UPI001D4136C0|nr:phosphonate ABC transporter substrate-binding protein [Limimaricola sp.]MBI1415933.1 phosphonate ABC transporter substrate-binding protein [Limimaricola sp.]